MESDQIQLQICINDITSDLVISSESANETKTNWTKIRIDKFHLENIYNN